MAHVAKYPAAAIGHMCNHYGRSEDKEKSAYIIRGNKNIDPSQTDLNYNLAPARNMTQIDFIHQRLSEVKVQKRADVNVLCDWVVTLPKGEYTEAQEKAFFAETYRFLSEKYGEKNVVSAFVHKDETTPHMHFAFIPVVPDRRWNEKHPEAPREKLSAKELTTRQDLRDFHPQLQRYLDDRFGEPDLFPVLNGATVGGNRTVAELQAEIEVDGFQAEVEAWRTEAGIGQELVQSLEHDVDVATQSLSEARQELQAVKGEITTLQAEKSRLQGEISPLRDALTKLKEVFEKYKDNVAVKFVELQEKWERRVRRTDRALELMPEQSRNDFLRAFERAKAEEKPLEQAVKPKERGFER